MQKLPVVAKEGESVMRLVLSLFPGADLFGKAFEAEGFCVVRGPDKLWGGDVRDFHVPLGRFDGVIGGPPCQVFSEATRNGTEAVDLIPEFARIVREADPAWAIMENVTGAYAPWNEWESSIIRDWDCGGNTHRTRAFWTLGMPAVVIPPTREGDPAYTVLASSWKNRGEGSYGGCGYEYGLTAQEAADLQGFSELAGAIMDNQSSGVSLRACEVLAVHMLGNGVPLAMGLWVARHVKRCLAGEEWQLVGLPMFEEITL